MARMNESTARFRSIVAFKSVGVLEEVEDLHV